MDLNSLGGGSAGALDSEFSLDNFFDFDTSDITAIDSKLPVKGMHIVRVSEPRVTISQSDDPAKPPLARISWKYEILESQPTDKNVDATALIGRKMNEMATIWPKSRDEDIGLIMGRYKKVGLPYHGRVGGNPDAEPGWLDGADEKTIVVRVSHYTSKDTTRARFDWLPYEQAVE